MSTTQSPERDNHDLPLPIPAADTIAFSHHVGPVDPATWHEQNSRLPDQPDERRVDRLLRWHRRGHRADLRRLAGDRPALAAVGLYPERSNGRGLFHRTYATGVFPDAERR